MVIHMSVFTLKCLAMLTMLCDHAGLFLMNNFLPMRCIGRLSFTAYAFLLAEGYVRAGNSKHSEREHLKLLLLLIIPGELAFDYAVFGRVSFIHQSVIPTLLLGYLGMMAADRLKSSGKSYFLTLLVYSAIALLALCLRSDYSLAGVLLIFAFYQYARYQEKMPLVKKFGILICLGVVYSLLANRIMFGNCTLPDYIGKVKANYQWIVFTFISFLPLAAYNSKRGINPPAFRTLYRYFYPLHLFFIILLREFIH